MPVKLGQVRYISNVFGHVLQIFFCTSISCIGVTPIDTYVVQILNMSWMPESLYFPFFFLYLYMSTQIFLLIPAAFLKLKSLGLYKHSVYSYSVFKSSCSHQIKMLIARHPFKNPLKALVTFQATCFCVFLNTLSTKKINKTSTFVNYLKVFSNPQQAGD